MGVAGVKGKPTDSAPPTARFEIPNAFSLLQAGLLLVRGRRPVPEELFASAPVRLRDDEVRPDAELGELVYGLRAGRIQARSSLTVVFPKEPELFFRMQVPSLRDFPILPMEWSFSSIEWNESLLRYSWLLHRDNCPIPAVLVVDYELYAVIENLVQSYSAQVCYCPVTIKGEEIAAFFPHIAPILSCETSSTPLSSARPKPPSLGGRPPLYDWDAIYREIIFMIHEDGLPKTLADLIRKVQWRCQSLWGEDRVPSDPTLKAKLSPLIRRMRSET